MNRLTDSNETRRQQRFNLKSATHTLLLYDTHTHSDERPRRVGNVRMDWVSFGGKLMIGSDGQNRIRTIDLFNLTYLTIR